MDRDQPRQRRYMIVAVRNQHCFALSAKIVRTHVLMSDEPFNRNRQFIAIVVVVLVVATVAVGGTLAAFYFGLTTADSVPFVDEGDLFGEEYNEAAIEQYVHDEVNEVRAEHNASALEYNTTVADAARQHSVDMANRGYFNHTDPDGNNVGDRMNESGVSWRIAGENLAQNWWWIRYQTDSGTQQHTANKELAEMIVQQWMESDDHRENMLRDDWTTQGIGVYKSDDNAVYVTQKLYIPNRGQESTPRIAWSNSTY